MTDEKFDHLLINNVSNTLIYKTNTILSKCSSYMLFLRNYNYHHYK